MALATSLCCWAICLRTVGEFGFANVGIVEIGLRRGQRALRRFDPALRRGHRGRLLVGRRLGLLGLTFGDGAGLGELGVGVLVEQRELIRRLLLRELRFGRGQFGFRLADPAGRIDFRLLGVQLRLPHLLFEHRDLIARGARLRFGVGQRGLRLFFARPNLVIVQQGDDVAGLDGVAFADADLENAAAQLRRDRGIVAFDAAAQRDHVVGDRCGEHAPPHERPGRGYDQQNHREQPQAEAARSCPLRDLLIGDGRGRSGHSNLT